MKNPLWIWCTAMVLVVQGCLGYAGELTLEEAEARFTKSNLVLLAEKYGVEVQKAIAIQAGLWENPEISLNQNIYNKETGKHFDTSKNGQTEIAISQVIYLAGQKGKAREKANLDALSQEEEFYDVLRNLKFELRSHYVQIHYKNQILKFYEESLGHLDKTLEIAEKNFSSGYITLIELMRIRGIVFSIETQKKSLQLELKNHLQTFNILLGGNQEAFETVMPDDTDEYAFYPKGYPMERAIDEAFEKRPDLKALKLAKQAERANLSLERSLAVPNLKIGGNYDRNSNYIRDYTGLTLSFEIPLFDRNQGNIQASKARLQSISAREENARLNAEKEIRLAFERARENEGLFKKYKDRFKDGFSKLATILNTNYQKRYLSVLEFSDSFESLRNSASDYLLLKAERLESFENINYMIGKEIVLVPYSKKGPVHE